MAKRHKPRGNPDQIITTTRGTKMFRSDLAQKVARANQILKKVQAEAKGTEFGQYKKQVLPPTMIKQGKLGIRGITDPGKLSAIEAAAEKIIKGGGPEKIKAIREDRYRKMSETFKSKWGLTQEEVDLLSDQLFSSPEWETLKQTYLFDSEQRARIINEVVKADREKRLNKSSLSEVLQALAWQAKAEAAGETPDIDYGEVPEEWKTPDETFEDYQTAANEEETQLYLSKDKDEREAGIYHIGITDNSVSKAQQILDAIRRDMK